MTNPNQPYLELYADHAAADYNDYLAKLTYTFVKKLFPENRQAQILELPLIKNHGLRQQLGEISLEYFARAYYPEYFTKPIGWFHREAYEELTSILASPPSRRRDARAWARSFGKSTIYNLITPANAALYGKRAFMLQGSDTETQGLNFLSDIKTSFEEKQAIFEDFGDIKGTTWRNDQLNVLNEHGTCTIAAIGAESSTRGVRQAQYRPQFIILDDLENDESVLTIERIEKRYKWLNRTLIPLGDYYTDIFYVGTVLAYQCVFDRVLHSPTWDAQTYAAVKKWSTSPLWDTWKTKYTDLSVSKKAREKNAQAFYLANKEEMLEGTEVLWEEGRPYIELMQTKVDIGDLSFQAEYQNEPINPADCIFDRSWLAFYDEEVIRKRVRFVEYVGALDPSLGKSKLGDYSAFITLARGDDGYIYVVDAVIERLPPDRIIEMVLQKAKQYPYVRVGVETNQFQDLLRLELVREAARRGIYLPVTEMRHNKDKVLRVQSLVPFVKNRYIRFRQDHTLLLEQLCAFPKGRNDDGPDALEMAVRLINKGPTIDAMEGGVDSRYGRRSARDEDDDNAFRKYGGSWMDY